MGLVLADDPQLDELCVERLEPRPLAYGSLCCLRLYWLTDGSYLKMSCIFNSRDENISPRLPNTLGVWSSCG